MAQTEEKIVSSLDSNFIQDIIEADLARGKCDGKVLTRFPPEPNGYLHIGHAKSICLNFGIAAKNGGLTNLRFDDTNPEKESLEYVRSIQEDVKWLGFDWDDRVFYTSNYFQKLYEFAIQLIEQGDAYVCDLDLETMREYRGDWNTPGRDAPGRSRTPQENLELFKKMRAGEFDEGSYTLRARIDMSSGNMNMRDPILYRIRKVSHHNTGDEWPIYPNYDFAHGLSDAIEGISHSICTLEFEDHRPLYDWILEKCGFDVAHRPQQIEFARLNLTNTIMSKRKLLRLVEEGVVRSWDDPRMPTIAGLRRRGYTPTSIRNFADRIGIAKVNSTVDIQLLQHFIRDELNEGAARAMVVQKPIKVIIDNLEEGEVIWLDAPLHPNHGEMGTRKVPFTRELWIEEEDFMMDAPKKFFRLTVDREVRFLNAFYVKCVSAEFNEDGSVKELHCTYDPATKGGWTPERKVKGTLHWVSATEGVEVEVRNYDSLLSEDESTSKDFMESINTTSEEIVKAYAEPALTQCEPGTHFQFQRVGYYVADNQDHSSTLPVFNQVVSLKESKGK